MAKTVKVVYERLTFGETLNYVFSKDSSRWEMLGLCGAINMTTRVEERQDSQRKIGRQLTREQTALPETKRGSEPLGTPGRCPLIQPCLLCTRPIAYLQRHIAWGVFARMCVSVSPLHRTLQVLNFPSLYLVLAKNQNLCSQHQAGVKLQFAPHVLRFPWWLRW